MGTKHRGVGKLFRDMAVDETLAWVKREVPIVADDQFHTVKLQRQDGPKYVLGAYSLCGTYGERWARLRGTPRAGALCPLCVAERAALTHDAPHGESTGRT